jgi:hypothetical protein
MVALVSDGLCVRRPDWVIDRYGLELLFRRCGTSGWGDGIVGWTVILKILQRFVGGFLQGFEFRALIFGERQGFFDAIGVREAEPRSKAAAKIADAGL